MKKRNSKLVLAAATVAVAGLAVPAFGQQRIWDGGGATNNWSEDANWNNTFTGTTGNIWRFGSTDAKLDTEMDQAYNLERIEFFNFSGWSINSAEDNILSLRGAGNAQTLVVGQPGTPVEADVNVPILLTERAVSDNPFKIFDVRPDSVLTINDTITSGIYSIRKAGPGTLVFNASSPEMANIYNVANGDTRLGTDTSLGTATITHSSGNNVRFLSNSGTALTLANDFVLDGAGAVSFTEVGGPDMTLTGDISVLGTIPTPPEGVTGSSKPFGVADGTTLTVDGVISGAGGVSKLVGGTMVLNAINTYTGNTNVVNGRLVLNGSIAESDTLVFGGTLSGNGEVRVLSVFDADTTDAVAGGTVSPGDDASAGILSALRADFAEGGTYLFNLNDVDAGAGSGWDLISLDGPLDVTAGTGGFTIDLDGAGAGFDPAQHYLFTLVDATEVIGFDSQDFVIDSTGFGPDLAGGTFSVQANGGDLQLAYTPIPEPASLALVGLGGLTLLRRRR